jgi:hypothetical protein
VRAGRLIEFALDGCLEVGDLLRGRKRLVAAAFMLSVMALSPETFIKVATTRAERMLDAVTDVVLDSPGSNRSTPVDLDAP